MCSAARLVGCRDCDFGFHRQEACLRNCSSMASGYDCEVVGVTGSRWARQMKTSLVLLLATVVPCGWLVLGAIVLWRFAIVQRNKGTPEVTFLRALPPNAAAIATSLGIRCTSVAAPWVCSVTLVLRVWRMAICSRLAYSIPLSAQSVRPYHRAACFRRPCWAQ